MVVEENEAARARFPVDGGVLAEECGLFLLHALAHEATACLAKLRELSLADGASEERSRRNYRAGLSTINDWPSDVAIEEAARLKVLYPGLDRMLSSALVLLARSLPGVYGEGDASALLEEDARKARLSDCYQRFMTYVASEPEAGSLDFVDSPRVDRRCLFADALRTSLHGLAARCFGLSRTSTTRAEEEAPRTEQPAKADAALIAAIPSTTLPSAALVSTTIPSTTLSTTLPSVAVPAVPAAAAPAPYQLIRVLPVAASDTAGDTAGAAQGAVYLLKPQGPDRVVELQRDD
jgi:hypothetical protein